MIYDELSVRQADRRKTSVKSEKMGRRIGTSPDADIEIHRKLSAALDLIPLDFMILSRRLEMTAFVTVTVTSRTVKRFLDPSESISLESSTSNSSHSLCLGMRRFEGTVI